MKKNQHPRKTNLFALKKHLFSIPSSEEGVFNTLVDIYVFRKKQEKQRLFSALSSKVPQIRAMAAYIIGDLFIKEGLKYLKPLAYEDEPIVRQEARSAISKIRNFYSFDVEKKRIPRPQEQQEEDDDDDDDGPGDYAIKRVYKQT